MRSVLIRGDLNFEDYSSNAYDLFDVDKVLLHWRHLYNQSQSLVTYKICNVSSRTDKRH